MYLLQVWLEKEGGLDIRHALTGLRQSLRSDRYASFHVYMHTYAFMRAYTCFQKSVSSVVYFCACLCMFIHVRICKQVDVCIYARIHQNLHASIKLHMCINIVYQPTKLSLCINILYQPTKLSLCINIVYQPTKVSLCINV